MFVLKSVKRRLPFGWICTIRLRLINACYIFNRIWLGCNCRLWNHVFLFSGQCAVAHVCTHVSTFAAFDRCLEKKWSGNGRIWGTMWCATDNRIEFSGSELAEHWSERAASKNKIDVISAFALSFAFFTTISHLIFCWTLHDNSRNHTQHCYAYLAHSPTAHSANFGSNRISRAIRLSSLVSDVRCWDFDNRQNVP